MISLVVSLAVKRRAKLPIPSPRCPDNGVLVVSIPMQDGIRCNARPLMFEVFRRAAHVGGVESLLTVVSAGISKDSVLLLYLERLSLKLCGIYLCFYFFFLLVVSLPLRTSIVVPWVRVSNAFYASLRLLKADNSGGLPFLSFL